MAVTAKFIDYLKNKTDMDSLLGESMLLYYINKRYLDQVIPSTLIPQFACPSRKLCWSDSLGL